MSEGRVYYATAQRLSSRWRLSITRPRRLTVEGADLEELKDELADEICGALGDGEAVIEVFDGLERAEDYIRLLYNESAVCPKEPDGLFEGGYCRWCGAGIGRRTLEPLQLCRMARANLAGANVSLRGLLLISHRLADVLEIEGRSCKLRPIIVKGKQTDAFREIIPSGEKSCVAQKGALDSDVSFKCPKCSFRQVTVKHRIRPGFYTAVSRKALPSDHRAFVVGDDRTNPQICLGRKLWKEIARGPERRGVSSQEIVIVAPGAVAISPRLPKLEKLI